MKSELILRETLSDVVFISNHQSHRKLRKENIQFFEMKEKGVAIHSIHGKHLQEINFSSFMDQFKGDHEFVRISDTTVVNLNYVDSIIRFTLFMGIRDFKVSEPYREGIFGVN